MVHWMAYCLAVGALLSAAAVAMEAALRAFRRPARWVWAAALALSIGIPAAVRWVPRAAEPAAPVLITAAPLASGTESTSPAAAVAATRPRIDLRALDQPLLAGWVGLSIGTALAWLAAWGMLQWRRRTWRERKVDGLRVLVSADTGPAVVGWIRGRIVLPEWVVRHADPAARRMILQHESEHLAAGDPRMLAVALIAVALVPWSPAAWWQLRRLRLAMEVDCDARVLARRADVRAYGELLLEVGRRGAGTRLPVAAMSEPRSFLERRIRMITQQSHPRPAGRSITLAVLAVAALACMRAVPLPAVPAVRAHPPAAAPASGDTVPPRITNWQQVQREFDRIAAAPGEARGDTGSVSLTIRVTTTGTVSDAVVIASSNPRHAEPAREAVSTARFRPATFNGENVAASITMTFWFAPGQQPITSARVPLDRYYPGVLEQGPGEQGQFTFVFSEAGEVIAHSRSVAPAEPQHPWRREAVQALLAKTGLRRDQLEESIDVSRIQASEWGPVRIEVISIRMKGGTPGS